MDTNTNGSGFSNSKGKTLCGREDWVQTWALKCPDAMAWSLIFLVFNTQGLEYTFHIIHLIWVQKLSPALLTNVCSSSKVYPDQWDELEFLLRRMAPASATHPYGFLWANISAAALWETQFSPTPKSGSGFKADLITAGLPDGAYIAPESEAEYVSCSSMIWKEWTLYRVHSHGLSLIHLTAITCYSESFHRAGLAKKEHTSRQQISPIHQFLHNYVIARG